jgi:hypothetical protein
MGANANSPFFYNKVKGKMEAALIAQKWEHLTIVRPSMLMGHRDKRRFNESIFAPLFRILPGNWKSIEARDVARAMLKEALSPSQEGVNIIPSAKLREIAQARRSISRLINTLLGNAMTGQSSSQAATPFNGGSPLSSFSCHRWPLVREMAAYYGKAFTAAETHSIGKSILAQADASPLQAAWDYAMVYFLAVWKAAVLGVLLGSLIQVLSRETGW